MRLIRLLKKDLAKEISTWVDKNLISADQARSICQLYDVDYNSIQSSSTGYRLLVSLGYLFIGLALITLISANWDQIPRWLRMSSLLAVTMGTHGLALRSYISGKDSSATGFFLLGNLFYGASIILIAQIYHLGEHMPDGVFWWALGSLPFGLLLRNPLLTLFSLLLAILWCLMEYGMGFFPTFFPLFIVAALYILIVGPQSTLLFLATVASIGLWIETSLSAAWAGELHRYELHAEHFVVSVAFFTFAYAFSHWLHSKEGSKAKDYGVMLSFWALRFGLITMLVLSYAEPWEELIHANWDHQTSMWTLVIVLLLAALWFSLKTEKFGTVIIITAFSSLSMIAAVFFNDSTNVIYIQVLYNIALIGTGIWLIIRGVHSGISHYFFLGVAAILLTAFMRYIDLIGEYVGGAILFMLLAVLLLGAAKYWKSHNTKGVSL